MISHELSKELDTMEQELLIKLNAIRILRGEKPIAHSNNSDSVIREATKMTDNKISALDLKVSPKGETMWPDYLLKVLKEIGKPVKSAQIIELMIKANPDIDAKMLEVHIKSLCSKMAIAGKIRVYKSGAASKGHDYALL